MAEKPRLVWKLEDVADQRDEPNDDDRAGSDEPKPSSPSIDAAAINERLRSLGVSSDELTVEPVDQTHLLLRGPLLDRLKTEPSRFRTAAMVTSPEQAIEALDRLVPGWRSD